MHARHVLRGAQLYVIGGGGWCASNQPEWQRNVCLPQLRHSDQTLYCRVVCQQRRAGRAARQTQFMSARGTPAPEKAARQRRVKAFATDQEALNATRGMRCRREPKEAPRVHLMMSQ